MIQSLELRETDALAAKNSPIHRLHPLYKLLVTLLSIVAVVSFPQYDFTELMVMVLRVVLPLACAVGL